MIYTYLQNLLIPKKRQRWEQISHWFDLQGEREEGNSKKKKKEGEKKGTNEK